MSTSGPDPFSSSPDGSRSSSPAPPYHSGIPSSSTRFASPTPSRGPSSSISAASGSPPPTHRPSFPDPYLPPKGSSRQSSKLTLGPTPKSGFCCERDKLIHQGEEISIVDAFKTSEGTKGSTYITYVIRIGTNECKRRYSSFSQLHQALSGLYPVLIIPPIPDKQSLTEYAVKGQSKAKEDAATIARRKRLLEDFLKRLIRHPILGGEHVLHRFLEDGVSWNEVMHSPPISLLPKNPLHAPSHNPTFRPSSPSSPLSPSKTPSSPPPSSNSLSSTSTATVVADNQSTKSTNSNNYIATHLLPTPSASHPLRKPDQRFHDSEVFTDKFQQHFNGNMEKVNRRVVKRWGEYGQDMSELGAVWNGFSLVEKGELGLAVEKVGQAVDQEYLATAALLQAWEKSATEPLHIYAQFANLIKQRLSFRHQKHVQYELVQDTLENQKDKLDILESAERESRRLDDALERGSSVIINNSSLASGSSAGNTIDGLPNSGAGGGGGGDNGEEEERARERERERERRKEERDKAERTISRARASGGFGLLNAVKHSLSGMMDVDPEASRRANIGKTRDNISQLEDSIQASAQDLKYASTTLQADLDRFQRQKVADLRQLAIQLSTVHREWCRQNLEAWEAAAEAIKQIPSHPNKPPPQAQHQAIPRLNEGIAKMGINEVEREVERVEAMEKPLPLPERDEDLSNLEHPSESSGQSGVSRSKVPGTQGDISEAGSGLGNELSKSLYDIAGKDKVDTRRGEKDKNKEDGSATKMDEGNVGKKDIIDNPLGPL